MLRFLLSYQLVGCFLNRSICAPSKLVLPSRDFNINLLLKHYSKYYKNLLYPPLQ